MKRQELRVVMLTAEPDYFEWNVRVGSDLHIGIERTYADATRVAAAFVARELEQAG